MDEQNKTSVGSIIGTIIIIAIIVLGGLYFWGKRIEESKNTQSFTQEMLATTTDQNATSEASVIKSSVGTTDDLDTLEADLKNTNTTNLSPELDVQAQ